VTRKVIMSGLLLLPALGSLAVENAAQLLAPWDLRTFGSLRAMFHENQLGAMVRLDSLLPNQHLYGLGALTELRGEITIVEGVPHIAYPSGEDSSHTQLDSTGRESACLLVVAEVTEWVGVTILEEVALAEFDIAVAELAESVGVDVDQAFPFLIEAEVADLRWHVIDGRRISGAGRSHRDHLGAAVKHHRAQATALLLGFYSRDHHGIFTHRDTNSHLHCIVREPAASGHVDHVILPAGTRIRFPREGYGQHAD